MGVCDSSTQTKSNLYSMSTDDNLTNNKSNNKRNIAKYNNAILKKNNSFILPENLSKRDDVNK